MKKYICLILSAILILCLFSGCNKEIEDNASSDNTIDSHSNEDTNNNTLVIAPKISKVVFTSEGEEQWHLEYQYTYDDALGYAPLDAIVEYSFGRKLASRIYDKSIDRLLNEIIYYDNGNENYHRHYEYNDSGVLTQVDERREEGKITETYKYNESGDIIEILKASQDFQRKTSYQYQYDASGNITKKITSYNDEVSSQADYSYKDNRLVEIVFTSNSEVKERITYTYDSDGRLITKIRQVTGLSPEETTYLYDEDGWLMGWENIYGKATISYTVSEVTTQEAEEFNKITEALIWE